MKRKLIAIIGVIIFLLQAAPLAYAHDRTEHDKQLEKVLFGRDNYHASQPKKEQDAIEALKCAVYLCIDQYNNHGEQALKTLKDYKVPNLPQKVDDINFSGNYTHREYTHKGWVPVTPPTDKDWSIKWPKRKEILLSTVNKVFDFGWTSGFSFLGITSLDYSEQCDAMAALLYYIHILGDIESLQDYTAYKKEGSYVYPFARSHPSEDNPDILFDLINTYLPKLFSSQKNSEQYKALIYKLQFISNEARSLVASTGGINSEEKYQKYRGYVIDTIETLSDYIPSLLSKESFFNKVFKD